MAEVRVIGELTAKDPKAASNFVQRVSTFVEVNPRTPSRGSLSQMKQAGVGCVRGLQGRTSPCGIQTGR